MSPRAGHDLLGLGVDVAELGVDVWLQGGVGPGGPANLKSRSSRTSMGVHPLRWLSNSSAGRLLWIPDRVQSLRVECVQPAYAVTALAE